MTDEINQSKFQLQKQKQKKTKQEEILLAP